MNKVISIILMVYLSGAVTAQTYETSEIYTGTSEYVTYHAGNLPLIISVPHGGALTPASIPDRSCNQCTTVTDTNTKPLGISLKEKIKEYTGCDVHMIVSELKRTKLDPNREIVEAALGVAEAETAWTEYHAFMDSAKAEVKRNWDRGLVIDLHGHGHSVQRLELGYVVTSTQLRESNTTLDSIDLSKVSIHNLVTATELSPSEALRGPESLGELFVDRGYDAVPSRSIPAPALWEPFFNGGYITDRYGSKDGSSIDAIQLECHRDIRFTDEPRERFADSLAVVLIDFVQKHYHMDLSEEVCNPTPPMSTSIFGSRAISEVKVFPNPVCGNLNISIDKPIDRTVIYNNLGQVVRYVESLKRVDVSSLENGVYHLLIESSGILYRQRISVRCN